MTRAESARWLLTAVGLLAAAYALVWFLLTLVNANGNWSGTPPSISLVGRQFEIVRGRGHPEGDAIVLEATDPSGVALVSARTREFSAATYPRVEWNVVSGGVVPPKLTFFWRTRERPNRTFSKPLEVAGGNIGRVAPLQLAGTDGWDGTIVGVALAVHGTLKTPLTIGGVSVPGISVSTSAREILGQWTRDFSAFGDAIALPFDKERDDHLSLLMATVAAQGLAIIAYLILARRRHDRVDRRIVWTILIGGWLVLDLHWQINLGRQLVDTGRRFAGKTDDEKHLSAADGALYAMTQRVKAVLPPPPARIFLFADEEGAPVRVRSTFFLFPHNVYQDRVRPNSSLQWDAMVAGDFVLLFPSTGIGFDREKQLLRWSDGRTRNVDLLFESPEGAILLRVK